MNPNPKIESYLDCGHELVCKPRASTTAGPTDGAARDSVARGAGGRTCRGASARHHRRASCWACWHPRRGGRRGPRMRQHAAVAPRSGVLHMRASGARRTRHASAADGRSSRSGAPWPRAAAPCGMRTAGGGRTRRTAARAAAARD